MKKIADMGHHLRHAYHRVDAEILWQLHASGQLAELKNAISMMLHTPDPDFEISYPPQ